jgi:amino acid adenylation domain-containing protein
MAETDRDAALVNSEVAGSAKPKQASLDPTTVIALSSSDFILYLEELGVELRGNDGKLQLNAPAGVLTSDLQRELRRRKSDLLAHLATLREDNTERVAPLIFAQQRLWLLDRFAPNSVTYNIPQSWVIEDDLDPQVLQAAIEKLIQRHPALRTSIEVRNGEPMQVIKRQVHVPFTVTDFNGEEDSFTFDEEVSNVLIEEGRKPFALDHAPLIRFHIIRIADRKWIFSYCVHHIVADQWSLDVLKRELTALYVETMSGQPALLPTLLTTYADFAIREKSVAVRGLHQQQLEYWADRLAGVPSLLELPFAASRGSQQSDAGTTLEVSIDERTTRRLRDLASRNHTSLYLLMLAVFETLLYRYTGQVDMCIGTPITGRKTRADEALIGMFVNMLPLRLALNPADSFEQLLRKVSNAVLIDFEYSDIPFQKLVTELHPHRSSSHAPLFQFLFALNPMAASSVGSQQETYIGISKYDLSLQIAERSETLDVFIEYRTELYAAHDVEYFGRRFAQLAQSISTSPETAIHALNLMTAEDLESASRWNQTGLAYDTSATLVSLLDRQFRQQLDRNADAIAIYSQHESLTYSQLQEKAISLASMLQAKGCGPGTYVAVCLDRTPELIVSILAILYAGAAYLPLDAKYPEDRLSYMLNDSGAKLLIAKRDELSSRLAAICPRLELLFAVEHSIAGRSHNFVPAKIAAGDIAYLIYTSGSTGQPKGVIVEHGNAVALIAWAQSYFASELLRGMLASTSICFDLSIFEIFVPLATGNSIILVNDVLELPRSQHAGLVTLVNTVPSAMSALLLAGLPAGVQAVCLAGEFLSTELVDRIYAAGVPQVFDLYGPTETTTYSTCTLRQPGAIATIGQPIANTRIYLLDEHLSEPPPGAIGEIFIGGAGVTRGYLNRPELTADRYLTLPAIEPAGRLYRTGDLARRQRDGNILYLGRRDQQIKLRGHRIELGEIEAALREVTHASELAVILQKRETGDALIAFVSGHASAHSTPASWLAALRQKLPAFMLPAQIILLASMPHTPNGKIDRNALGQTAQSAVQTSKPALPPRNMLEQWIANIWAHRLGRSYVARNQHFFEELGGHSLVAFEIFAEIERRIGVEMMLATLFQAPSVELLAPAVQRLPHRVPANLAFVKEGLSEVILYQLPMASALQQNSEDHGSAEIDAVGNRIMRLLPIKDASAIDIWTQEIAAFESNMSTLSLIASSDEAQRAEQLSTSLAKAGFPRVEVQVIAHAAGLG